MASLFDLLRDTMPIAAAENAAKWGRSMPAAADEAAAKRTHKTFDDLERDDVLPFLRYLEPDESYEAIKPPIKDPDYHDMEKGPLQRVWSWKHDANDPAVISDIWCRVRDAGFISHKVLDSIEWGYENEAHEYKKCVRATLKSGTSERVVELPLETEFIAAKWVVMAGAIHEDQTPLWKLTCDLDKGLVIAFIYEIDANGQAQSWKPKPADLEGRDTARETSAAGRQTKAPKPHPPAKLEPEESPYVFASYTAPAEESSSPPGAESWGLRVRKGDLMPRGTQTVVTGQIPSVKTAELGPGRILVVLSLATCRENSDFFPGDVFGMCRIYPHVMFMSSMSILKMEASVRYNRPPRTTFADPLDGVPGAKPTCHDGFDASNGLISTLMVADANDSKEDLGLFPGFLVLENKPMPFWSYLFSYYLSDAHKALGSETMRVARTDRRWERAASGLVTRDIEQGDDSYGVLCKEARQGEFDNMHMAPTMRINGAVKAYLAPTSWFDALLPTVSVDISSTEAQEALKLTDISMAPFCVHDCLHTHWRWSPHLNSKAVLGWDENGPNVVAGAPQVPTNQAVSIWLRSDFQMTYHVEIGRDDGSVSDLPPAEWQVVMHHGSAYAVYVVNAIQENMARLSISTLHEGGSFMSDLDIITPSVSHASFYWHLRYYFEPAEDIILVQSWRDLRVRERTIVTSMRGARDL